MLLKINNSKFLNNIRAIDKLIINIHVTGIDIQQNHINPICCIKPSVPEHQIWIQCDVSPGTKNHLTIIREFANCITEIEGNLDLCLLNIKGYVSHVDILNDFVEGFELKLTLRGSSFIRG
jgi:hypothetical protein